MVVEQSMPGAEPGYIMWVRRGYVGMAWLIVAMIAAQVFLAGMNVFVGPRWWGWHIQSGHAIGGMIGLLALLGFGGRFPGRIRWLTLALLGLFALQYNHRLIAGALGIPSLAAIHAVNALVLFWLAVSLARWAGVLLRSEQTERSSR
jgi:hypothetical protein